MTTLSTGTKVILNTANDSFVTDRAYNGLSATVEFQMPSLADVEGLVYVSFIPTGKRKPVTKAFNILSLSF
jgi:hypothetical protein